MEELPATLVARAKVAFDSIDLNHDGRISKAEIQTICRKLDYDWPEADYDALFEDVSPVSKELTFAQVLRVRKIDLPMLLLFMMIDKNSDGHLTFTEMKEMSRLSSGPLLPDELLRSIFRDMDSNGDGEISFKEFLTFFRKTGD